MQIIVVGLIVVSVWNDSGFMSSGGMSVSSVHNALVGAAIGSLVFSVAIKEGVEQRKDLGWLESLFICILPIAATIAFFCHFAGVLAIYGGWNPTLRFMFMDGIPSAIATFLEATAIVVVPLLPLGLFGWVLKGFSAK